MTAGLPVEPTVGIRVDAAALTNEHQRGDARSQPRATEQPARDHVSQCIPGYSRLILIVATPSTPRRPDRPAPRAAEPAPRRRR